ncbi:MAG TPA: SDR family oxidoreductase, partial [Kofleriaceae bacterium]|nr:SDR family oxidoreductase [Kofleriaceae bacterium]
MDQDLSGRTVVITGASRGIGAGLARALHARGARVALCARHPPTLYEGDRVIIAQFDITDEKPMDDFVARIEQRWGAIDLWINNAGILEPMMMLRDIPLADFRRNLEVNVLGVFLGTRAYVRHLHRRDHRGGVLINISSGAARKGYAGWAAYCASKAAVDLLSESVALEEQEIGLRVHAVAPGVVDTDMQTLIRATSADRFPSVDRFVQMKEEDTFSTIPHVAQELVALAFGSAHTSDPVRTS